jgi:hypothetical protein
VYVLEGGSGHALSSHQEFDLEGFFSSFVWKVVSM